MSARRSTGVLLIASGSIGITVGFLLSITGIGAICGIPLVLVCIPMMIWGYLMKAKDQEIKDERFSERMLQTQAVASGINICPQCRNPNQNTSPFCSGCGHRFVPLGTLQPASVVNPIKTSHRANELSHSAKQVKNVNDLFADDN